jgi:hypothetical protein
MLISLDDLKTYLKIAGTTLDAFLTDAIEKAGAQLDVVTNRSLLYQTDEEIYIGNGLDRIFTKNFPVAYVNEVTVYNKNGNYEYDDLFDSPDTVSDSLIVQKHGERLLLKKGYVFAKDFFVKIDYTWGYDIGQSGEHKTPEDLQSAVIQLAADYYLQSFQGDSRLGKSAVNVGGAATSGTKYKPVDLTNIIARYRVKNV